MFTAAWFIIVESRDRPNSHVLISTQKCDMPMQWNGILIYKGAKCSCVLWYVGINPDIVMEMKLTRHEKSHVSFLWYSVDRQTHSNRKWDGSFWQLRALRNVLVRGRWFHLGRWRRALDSGGAGTALWMLTELCCLKEILQVIVKNGRNSQRTCETGLVSRRRQL